MSHDIGAVQIFDQWVRVMLGPTAKVFTHTLLSFLCQEVPGILFRKD